MEKLFRYIFIALALAFSVFFLWPSSTHRATPNGFYSPVDGTRVSALIYLHKGANRWEAAHYIKSECKFYNRNCGMHPFEYGILEKIVDLSDLFSRKSILYKEAEENLYKEWREKDEKISFEGVPGMQQVRELGKPLYEDYLNSQKLIIKYITWILNFACILISMALIMLRASFSKWACKILGISATLAEKVHKSI